jgi:hypothetical protein
MAMAGLCPASLRAGAPSTLPGDTSSHIVSVTSRSRPDGAKSREGLQLLGIPQGGRERVRHLILYGSCAPGRSHRNLSESEREEGAAGFAQTTGG